MTDDWTEDIDLEQDKDFDESKIKNDGKAGPYSGDYRRY